MAPDGSSVARNAPGANPSPYQSTASFTSPPTEIHSASASGPIASCGTPGAILRAARGALRAAAVAQESGGEYASGSKTRPRPPRRAGSTKTASYGDVSISATSAHRTSISPVRPSASALARATSTVSGSRSTASTEIPARASAIASPPMPQHRSATLRTPSPANRVARWAATEVRVACSTPSGVKNIRYASSAPNFATARCRNRACPSAADTSSAGYVRRSRVAVASSSAGSWSRRSASSCPPSGVRSAAKAARAGSSADAGEVEAFTRSIVGQAGRAGSVWAARGTVPARSRCRKGARCDGWQDAAPCS